MENSRNSYITFTAEKLQMFYFIIIVNILLYLNYKWSFIVGMYA
jgi:hypothetical protein